MSLLIPKKVLINYSKLFFLIVLSALILQVSNNVFMDILAFIFLTVGAMSIVGFDLAHPYVWYSFVFMIYSISYPILYINGVLNDVYVYTDTLIISQWLALVTFLIVVTPHKIKYSKLKPTNNLIFTNDILLFAISIFLLLVILEISINGYEHKSEIYSEASMFTFIGFRLALVLIILFAFTMSQFALKNNKVNKKIAVYVVLLMFLLFFFSGERDLLIRTLVVFLFIYHILVKDNKLSKEIILIGIVSLLLIPLMQQFKYFGLTGETNDTKHNFLIELLLSEFSSASKNLQILLLDHTVNGVFEGATFVSATIRALNIENLFNINILSSNAWFNNKYFELERAGQGFTLVGDGYINYGYLGIIILFIFIGILVRILYALSNKNIFYFVLYIVSIPILMYATRADFANVLTQIFNQNVLIVFILSLVIKYSQKKHQKNLKEGVTLNENI